MQREKVKSLLNLRGCARGSLWPHETQGLRHSEAAGRGIPLSGAWQYVTVDAGDPNSPSFRGVRQYPASDANPAKWIASEKEEQGSERSFRHKAEAEFSGLCDDAIPYGGAHAQPWTRKGLPLHRHPREAGIPQAGATQYVVVTLTQPTGGFPRGARE